MAALEREHNYRVKSLSRGQLARDKVGERRKLCWLIVFFFTMVLAIYLYSRLRVPKDSRVLTRSGYRKS